MNAKALGDKSVEMKTDTPAIRMKTVFLLSCLLYEGASFHIQGLERGHVSFHCFHSYAWTNDKYLCRHPCQEEKDKVIAVNSRQTAESGRFSLYDEGNKLTVNISRLQLSDAGLYYCGVDRVGLDTFIEVHLTVDKVPEPPTTDPPTRPTTTTPPPSTYQSTEFTSDTVTTGSNFTTGGDPITGTALYAGLGAAALLAMLVLVICFRKCRNRPKAQAPVHLSNSDFVKGHKAVAKHESPGISESALQPSKGKTAKSTPYKQPPRRKKQTSASNAGRSQPQDIYENVSFHKGAASSRDEAANLHEPDDMCAIYGNV